MNNFIKENDNIMCFETPLLIDVSNENIMDLLTKYNNKEIEYLEDGTMMRLYYNTINKEWVLATNNIIDASQAFWTSSKSFAELFWEIVGNDKEEFINVLDTEFTYYFILLHTENIHIINIRRNLLIYSYSINNSTGDKCRIFPIKFFNFVKSPIKFKGDLETKKRGLLIHDDGNLYKYDFEFFQKMKIVRGNEKSVEKRYLQLMYEGDFEKSKILKNYYKNHNFDNLMNLVNKVYSCYIDSHIKHEKIEMDEKVLKLCKTLHYHYKTFNEKINKKNVMKILASSF